MGRHRPLNEALCARADVLRQTLESQGLALGWMIRTYRELPHSLHPEPLIASDRAVDHRFVLFDESPHTFSVSIPQGRGE
jgi:hypothetical protein